MTDSDVVCKKCIITWLETRGFGRDKSSIRRILQVWDAETSELIAENDPVQIYNRASDTYTRTEDKND